MALDPSRKVNITNMDNVDVLSPTARKRLLQEKSGLERYINDQFDSPHEYSPKKKNTANAKKRIKYLEHILEKGTPDKPKGEQCRKMMQRRDWLIKNITEIREKHGMTRDALQESGNGARLLKCQMEVNPLIYELRRINYTLDHDDTTLGNTEFTRRGGAEGRMTMPIPGMTKR